MNCSCNVSNIKRAYHQPIETAFKNSVIPFVCMNYLHTHKKVCFPPAHASADSPHLVLATTSFPEVSDRGELCVNGLTVEPTVVEVHDCFFSILLSAELRDMQRNISITIHSPMLKHWEHVGASTQMTQPQP